VSWFQENPEISFSFIKKYSFNRKDLAVIDIGGGNSILAAEIVKRNFSNLCILEISKITLE
jgi:hypothetical protein